MLAGVEAPLTSTQSARPCLSLDHRRLLLVEHGLGAALVNFALNAGIAWLSFSSSRVPLWGTMSIAADTVATGFLLPLSTCLIVDRIMRGQVARGRVCALPEARRFAPRWIAQSSLRRGTLVGVAGVAVTAVPMVACLALAGVTEMPLPSFVWFKAGFAAALGAVITPLIGWWALVRASATA